MGKESNDKDNITRTEDIALDNSEVELYLDKSYLDAEIDQYVSLKSTLDSWAAATQTNITETQNNSSGEASFEFVGKGNEFLDIDFEILYERTTIALRTLSTASVFALQLLLRCENFYEILKGNAGYVGAALPAAGVAITLSPVAQQSLTSELYLDKTYYNSGVINDDTVDAVARFTSISEKKGELLKIIADLESSEAKELDITAECEAIQDDCDKKGRLETLFGSFETYVTDVGNFNTNICDSFENIIDTRMAFDFSRSYEYPEISGVDQNIILQRAIRSELHEMGLTDEEIKNATANSSFTLQSLAAGVEAMVAEDKIQRNNGTEILLFKSFLSGNIQQGCNSYGGKLSDKADVCWYNIAKYEDGLVHTEYYNGEYRFSGQSYEAYIKDINGVLASDNRDDVLSALKRGSYILVQKNSAECAYLYDNGEYEQAQSHYVEYKKNLLIYDTYYFISQKIDADNNIEIPGISKKYYQITGMNYDNSGLTIDFMKYSGINGQLFAGTTPLGMPATQVGDIYTSPEYFSMDISENVGFKSVNSILQNADNSKVINDAIKEQQEMVDKVIKDAVALASYGIGPEGPAVVEGLYKAKDGLCTDNVKDLVDKGIDRSTSWYYLDDEKAGNVSKGLSTANGLLFDTYSLLSYSGIDEAREAEDCKAYAKLAGSAGGCKVVEGGEASYYANPHVGVYAPGYDRAFNEIMTYEEGERHGLAELCDWDEETVSAIKQELEDHAASYVGTNGRDESTQEFIDRMTNLIDGGYSINESTDYSDFYSDLDSVNSAYNSVVPSTDPEAPPSTEVFDGWSNDVYMLGK